PLRLVSPSLTTSAEWTVPCGLITMPTPFRFRDPLRGRLAPDLPFRADRVLALRAGDDPDALLGREGESSVHSSAPVGAPYPPASAEGGGSVSTPTANASRGRMRILPTVSYPAGASG